MADITAQTCWAAPTGRINFANNPSSLPVRVITLNNGTNEFMTENAMKIHVSASDFKIGITYSN
jgi:hypothetical protein